MVEQGTRVDRLVSIDVVERFEALQDEVDLLKNEIKQTLVDIREYMMKDRTVFSQPKVGTRNGTPAPLPPRVIYAKEPQPQTGSIPSNGHSAMHDFGPFGPGPHGEGMDPLMLGKVIQWLGTVQQRGLNLQQVNPFLEAYEASGYLPPIMLKVLLRTLADLDQMTDPPPDDDFYPERYSECIGELHDIICAVGDVAKQPQESIEDYAEAGPEETGEVEPIDERPADNHAGVHDPDETVESDAGRYNLTTIRVPDPEDQGDEGLNG